MIKLSVLKNQNTSYFDFDCGIHSVIVPNSSIICYTSLIEHRKPFLTYNHSRLHHTDQEHLDSSMDKLESKLLRRGISRSVHRKEFNQEKQHEQCMQLQYLKDLASYHWFVFSYEPYIQYQ